MPNAPCARLTKFISPSVTDRPTDRTNNSIPKANPSKRTIAAWPATCGRPGRRGYLAAPCSGSFTSAISSMMTFCSLPSTSFTSRI